MVGGRPSHPLQERLYSFDSRNHRARCCASSTRWVRTGHLAVPLSQPRYRLRARTGGVELGDHEPDFETRLNELGYDSTTKPITRRSGSFWRVSGSANLPECLNQRLMQPLFLYAHASSNGVFSSLRSKIITRLRTVLGCFPAPLPATMPRHSRAPHRYHRFMPANRGVNHWVADLLRRNHNSMRRRTGP